MVLVPYGREGKNLRFEYVDLYLVQLSVSSTVAYDWIIPFTVPYEGLQ